MKSYQTQHEKEGYLFIYFFKELKEKFEWVDNFKVWCIVKKKFKKKGKKKKNNSTKHVCMFCMGNQIESLHSKNSFYRINCSTAQTLF